MHRALLFVIGLVIGLVFGLDFGAIAGSAEGILRLKGARRVPSHQAPGSFEYRARVYCIGAPGEVSVLDGVVEALARYAPSAINVSGRTIP